MAIFTVGAEDVKLTSTWKCNGGYSFSTPTTASVERYFSFAGIPAGSVIHSATLYGTLGSPSTGAAIRTLNGSSFNGSMAVSASVGGGFTATFRFKANGEGHAHASVNHSSVLNITGIYINVDYTPPSSNPGTLSLDKSSLTAGESVRVSLTGADSGVTRDVTVWYGGSHIGTVVAGAGNGATYFDFVVPESWCGTIMPNGTSASIAFAMVGIKGGVQVGSTSYGSLTVNLPSTAIPSIGGFTATKVANGVPAGITAYVQGISKVTLEMSGVSGALGSTIAAYYIAGGGFSEAGTSIATFGPLMNAGDITFTATIVDSRGRTASRTVTITVTGYTLPSIASPSAWRAADSAGSPSDEGSWIICKGTAVWTAIAGNSVTFQSRVYEKGTTPPAWVTTTSGANKAHGGSLLHTKQYMAEIRVADLIGEAIWSIQISSSSVAIDIIEGATGMGLGEYAESGKLKVAWPIYAQGSPCITTASMPPNPNLFHNWDFRNPVNQRGAVWVSGANAYGLDRWKVPSWGGAYNVGSGSISNHGGFTQRIENVQQLLGKVVTLSVCVSGVIQSRTFNIPSTVGGITYVPAIYATASAFFAPSVSATSSYIDVQFDVNEVIYDIQMVKLELGTISTLHLDPPMDYGVELAKCQRYFIHLNPKKKTWRFYCFCHTINGNNCYGHIMLPVPMRIKPSLSWGGTIGIFAGGDSGARLTVIEVSDAANGAECINLEIYATHGGGALSPNQLMRILSAGDGNSYITLSADL